MNDFKLFVLNTHEFFFALLASTFIYYFFTELQKYKENANEEKRTVFTILFFSCFFALTAFFYVNWPNIGMLLAPSFAILVLLSIINPKYAVSFFIYLMLSRPWETFENHLMDMIPRDAFYLVALSVIGHKILKRQFYIRINFSTVAILGFSAWVFLSAFFSGHQIEGIYKFEEIFSKGIILFLLIQNGYETKSDLLPAKAALVLAILEKSIVSFYNTINLAQNASGLEEEYQRLESIGILSNSNDISAIFVLAIPFCLFFILKTKIKPLSWLVAFGALGGMALLVWQSQSRGAVLALFASLCSYFALKVKTPKQILTIMIAGLIAGVLSLSLMNRKAEDVEGSTNNRIIFWKAGANMAIRNPVFGVGFWGFNRNFAAYAIDGDTGSEGTNMTAHSSWVQVVAENGFIGLFLFMSLWIYALYRAWLIRVEEPEYFMSIVGYGGAITFLSHAYLLFPYILLSMVITHSFAADEKISKKYLTFKLPTKKLVAA